MATMAGIHQHHSFHASDMDVLDAISSMPLRNGHSSHSLGFDPPPRKRNLDTLHALRRPPIDPIVLAASLSSGPHVTRHHFHHSFGPKVESKQMSRSRREKLRREEGSEHAKAESSTDGGTRGRAGSYANCDRDQTYDRQKRVEETEQALARIVDEAPYPSKQGPRSERLKREKEEREAKIAMEKIKKDHAKDRVVSKDDAHPSASSETSRQGMAKDLSSDIHKALHERKEIIQIKQGVLQSTNAIPALTRQQSATTDLPTTPGLSSIVRPPPIHVRCYARTRIPTPHGEIFCHLYRNNRDNKEHLALVVDTAQNAAGGQWENTEEAQASTSKSIRSRTLDEVWGPHETEMERIVRGAYVGRLGPNYQVPSKPSQSLPYQPTDIGPPLVRIHSECYTGETIGSQRCDCGEQLDEAIRLIHSDSQPARGVVVYLRQEGRGIGLLDKLMAYNLQDMGHDTVSANILLGHLADARKYDVAAEILRDLGVGSCRLLTNNPEKMEALESEGITVERRVAMIPRVWRHGHMHMRRTKNLKAKKASRIRGLEESVVSQLDGHHHHTADEDGYSDEDSDASRESYVDHVLRRSGATMVGASMTRGPELEKYLRTKVERMGHLLDVPTTEQTSQSNKGSYSSPHLESEDGFEIPDAPLTDEEPLMDEKDLKAYVHAEQDADNEDDDEILITNSSRAAI